MRRSQPPGPRSPTAARSWKCAILFFATPARLKFMKSERAEAMAVSDVVKRLAMARPDVAFSLEHDGRASLRLAAERDPENEGRRARLAAILGADFAPNSLALDQTARRRAAFGFRGLADVSSRHARASASVRQWPAGEGQADRRRGARGVSGFAGARSPSGGGAVCRSAAGGSGCERASGEDGSALSRCEPRARADRRRAAACACRGGPSRIDHDGAERALGACARTFAPQPSFARVERG